MNKEMKRMVAKIDECFKGLKKGDVVVWKINQKFRSVVTIIDNDEDGCNYNLNVEMYEKGKWNFFNGNYKKDMEEHTTMLYETLTKGLVK